MPESCTLNLDHVTLVQRSRLDAVITELAPARWPEIERASLVARGFGPTDHDNAPVVSGAVVRSLTTSRGLTTGRPGGVRAAWQGFGP